jgi:hypothetical protein
MLTPPTSSSSTMSTSKQFKHHDCGTAAATFTALVVSLNQCGTNDMWRYKSAKKTAIVASVSMAVWFLINLMQVNVNMSMFKALEPVIRHGLNLATVYLPLAIFIGLDEHPTDDKVKLMPVTKNARTKYALLFLSPTVVYLMGSTEKIQTMACNLLHSLAPASAADLKKVASSFSKTPAPKNTGYSPFQSSSYPSANTQSLGVNMESPSFVKPMTNHKTTVVFGKDSKRGSNVSRFDGLSRRR